MAEASSGPVISVEGLSIGFGDVVVQHDISFDIAAGSIFAIMGGSGSGKSTLLKAMIGLLRPTAGVVRVGDEDYWAASEARRDEIDMRFGVLFQAGALWTSMTVGDNVALPLRMLAHLDAASIDSLTSIKLALVGLDNAGDLMPNELSGGMVKRAALARAQALDPAVLFLDEPSAGLDPVSAKRLDDLILELRDGFGMTVVMVSHELSSLFGICDDGVFLDAESKTAIARGSPSHLRDTCDNPTVHDFMHRERSGDDRPGPGDTHERN
jgi:phospholipid/cholesterol/gamma-HCH transport system ATP-binding protein